MACVGTARCLKGLYRELGSLDITESLNRDLTLAGVLAQLIKTLLSALTMNRRSLLHLMASQVRLH